MILRTLALLAFVTPLAALPKPDPAGVTETGPYDYGVMGPPTTPGIVAEANKLSPTPIPPGPFKPDWDSIRANYKPPSWFDDAKFGIFMHWGLYSVPAHRNEWYEKHLYAADLKWHTDKFGPPEKFGYKDFIPLFTAHKFDATEWADLFYKSGAKVVLPCAQHHDNFALWDSKVTPFNAKAMGPKRDLIGELAAASRAKGLKFGVSNHGIENFTFIDPSKDVLDRLSNTKADLFDPKWKGFYHVADRSDAAQSVFLADWMDRNFELIDKYQPDLLWFDNGVNLRLLDPLKLRVAAYYYNRANSWKKEVSLATKFVAYAPTNKDTEQVGSIIDFEKVGNRSPSNIRPGSWMVDDPIGTSWGYTEGMRGFGPEAILGKLIDTVSKGGFYLLNLAPKADGTIPKEQQDTLLAIGKWLGKHGEAIYGTRPWTQHGDGKVRFTTKGDTLYAILPGKPAKSITLTALAEKADTPAITKIELLGDNGTIKFKRDGKALEINLPATANDPLAQVLKLTLAK
ncbi:MAG TPA: alpha-L-fucosidase [Haloferula sp.]